ncbi:MAG: hypothetical protein L0227_12935, partial [Chloroflexi bacterium]|nr:hypothetical protein [Chloroflexota bacterium]
GGGLYNAAGSVTITRSSIESNRIMPLEPVPGIVAAGGGLASDGGEVIIVDSSVASNSIEVDGHPADANAAGGGLFPGTRDLLPTARRGSPRSATTWSAA